MAQGKVTDFFSARKRNPHLQPSKRRKVEITASEVDISTLDRSNSNPYRNLSQLQNVQKNEAEKEDERKENTVFSPLQTRASRKAKAAKITSAKTTRTRTAKVDSNQKLISDSFVGSEPTEETKKGKITLGEAVTSAWDDHDGAISTPVKDFAETVKTRKRTRNGKTNQKELQKADEATPEKRQPVEKVQGETKARKKLQLAQTKERTELEAESKSSEAPITEVAHPSASEIPPLNPVPTEKKNAVKMSANLTAALERCKSLKEKKLEVKKTTFHDMKASLAKAGSLEDLKARLAEMKQTREKIGEPKLKKFDKIQVEVKEDSETKPKVPAYERFHHLATSAAPTLSLPYKYRLLAEQFRGMDQVVSMLHNRNETCTFSKLKVAVQELTKRNFEKQHVGKIKTVYPEAYELRQEKGLQNMQGFRQPGYQLTVEARLDDDLGQKTARQTFKASQLLTRRNVFHNSLIHIVKQHQKEFLSKLSQPLSIPDDKITRWHPKFPLDEVPDVLESPLPQPPDVQTYQTAKDVLECTRGKLSPKVEAALQSTAREVEKSSTPISSQKLASTPTKPANSMKGVPLSLLEKIRAKEAANTAAALTRDPKEEKRQSMMKRLPGMMRIIRSHFVTEKKPALPIDSVIQRVLDSYKTSIAPGDIEPHINLCMEILPEWISSVQIKKGKYLKIDRNIDLQQLTDKVNNVIKGKK